MPSNNSRTQQRTLAQRNNNYPKSRLIDELDRNPAGVIARFRLVHAEASEPPSLSPPTDFGCFISDLVYAICMQCNRSESEGVARAVELVNCGLVEAFAAVVESEGFFL